MRTRSLTRTNLACTGLAAAAVIAATASGGDGDPCEDIALQGYLATLSELQSDFYLAYGNCLNQADLRAQNECLFEAFAELEEGLELADEQFDARVELCAMTGGGVYAPAIDPDDFSTTIDNPFFPLSPGTVKTYEAMTDEGLETVVVTVTEETRDIMGVECLAVSDIASLDGEVIEETLDYFAQDGDGNVWYFGEISLNFEDGYLTDIDGSWFAGVEGAQPGILMHGTPTPGTTYRQEFALGEAEDAGTVVSTEARASVPYGDFTGCLMTNDFTPVEPDALEHKFYVAGIGPVLEINPQTGERLELISVTQP